MSNIQLADMMSDRYNKIKITLATGEEIIGKSLGIEPAFDNDGEELEYEQLVLEPDEKYAYIRLRNEDIKGIDKAS